MHIGLQQKNVKLERYIILGAAKILNLKIFENIEIFEQSKNRSKIDKKLLRKTDIKTQIPSSLNFQK